MALWLLTKTAFRSHLNQRVLRIRSTEGGNSNSKSMWMWMSTWGSWSSTATQRLMAAAPDEPEVMKGTAIGGWMWVSLCSTYPISEVQLKLNKKEWRKNWKLRMMTLPWLIDLIEKWSINWRESWSKAEIRRRKGRAAVALRIALTEYHFWFCE